MKRIFLLLVPAVILVSCGGGGKTTDKTAELDKLKKERSDIDAKIKALEGNSTSDSSRKATPVSLLELQPTDFVATVNVQSQITGDQYVSATSQASGTVTNIFIHTGDHVTKGQVLATLDASAIDRQVEGQQAQLTLVKAVYEKQKNLWAQNIGTEVQLLTAKANYESAESQQAALIAQKNMYRIVSPITGTIDQMVLKVGDMASPMLSGIHIVNTSSLKAEAMLGENYLGKVKTGDAVSLIFPDLGDSIKTALSYVAEAVDNNSRAFQVQVKLGSNPKLHPNMSCIMKIADYENRQALVVPVSVIQKTSQGSMLYIADGSLAKSVMVTTGRDSNGQVEILSGLKPGDHVITQGYEELSDGQRLDIQ